MRKYVWAISFFEMKEFIIKKKGLLSINTSPTGNFQGTFFYTCIYLSYYKSLWHMISNEY